MKGENQAMSSINEEYFEAEHFSLLSKKLSQENKSYLKIGSL